MENGEDPRYEQALATIAQLLQKLDLSPREEAALANEIHHLKRVLHKLEHQVIQIAVFGMVGRGKSSLLNALVGQPIFHTGPLHGVTRQAEGVHWQIERSVDLFAEPPNESVLASKASAAADHRVYRASLSGQRDSRIELIDTPGIDEVGGEARQAIAQRVARQADLILFVIAGDLTQLEFTALQELHRAAKPILLVLNKADQFSPSDRQQILETLKGERLAGLLPPEHILIAAADPKVTQAVRRADGTITTHTERGLPDVGELKLKILDILQREGKALVALNTLLYADDINQQVVAQKLALRDRAADEAIWKTVLTKAVAVALNPLTMVDLLGGAAIDLALIVTLARLYGLEMTQTGAAQLLRTIGLATGGLGISELVVNFGLSSLKGLLAAATLPTGGLTATPYLSVALTQAAVSGVSTYAIAQVTKTYLANGATWGDESPKAVVARILSELDEASIMAQIRSELSSKLDLKAHFKK